MKKTFRGYFDQRQWLSAADFDPEIVDILQSLVVFRSFQPRGAMNASKPIIKSEPKPEPIKVEPKPVNDAPATGEDPPDITIKKVVFYVKKLERTRELWAENLAKKDYDVMERCRLSEDAEIGIPNTIRGYFVQHNWLSLSDFDPQTAETIRTMDTFGIAA